MEEAELAGPLGELESVVVDASKKPAPANSPLVVPARGEPGGEQGRERSAGCRLGVHARGRLA